MGWKKIIRWLLAILISAILLIAIVLTCFDVARIHREVGVASSDAPKSGHFVPAGDLNVFVQEAGPQTGPGVVLIHGTGTWSEIWRDTIIPLAKAGFHVIALDIPPFGYSDKPKEMEAYSRTKQAERIIGALEALRLSHITIIGHSVGARPTVEAALKRPDLIGKLVLVDPALGFSSGASSSPHFEQNHASWIVKTFFSLNILRDAVLSVYGTNPSSIKSLLSSFVYNKSSLTDARIHTIQQPMTLEGTTDAYGDWLGNLSVGQDDSLSSDFSNLKKLAMPISIIWGWNDQTTPLWQGEALTKLIPGSTLTVIDGVGHIPYIENVEKFNSVLLGILRK